VPRKTGKISSDVTAQLNGTPDAVAKQIRRALKEGGASEHAAGVQWFFNVFCRRSLSFPDSLLDDSDDMVQKGLGWLLRETAKYGAKNTVPYLMKIRERAPRLVLRTACETLPEPVRKRILNVKR
jgi:hypothetical protein